MIVFVIFAAVFAAVGVRLFWLQVVDAPELSSAAEARRTNVVTLSAKRGTIYDRNGNVLAMSEDCKTIYCNPHEVTDASAVAKVLADDLGGQEGDYIEELTNDTTFVYVKRKVDTSVADQLKSDLSSANLTGVYYLADTKRIYPYGNIAGQILGLVGTDGQGLSGLELEYNDILSGTDGKMIMEQGSDGTPIAGGVSEVTDAVDGTDIVLSIDINIQTQVEETISQGVTDYLAEFGMCMVTEPSTGEILAACSTPLLDPSDTTTVDAEAMSLKLVSSSYEPGSMFKLITMASGLDAGIITPDSTFSVPAKVKVGDDYVSDDDDRDYTMDMSCSEIIRRSSNTGAVLVAEAIGAQTFSNGVSSFGIGTKTGIDYPGEVNGLVTQYSDYTSATLGAMAFGQSLAIPMTQIVRAVGGIANSGTLTTPHFLVTKGKEKVAWNDKSSACSSSTCDQLIGMMRGVVEDGTGTSAQVSGYDIVGKTGTGEQADPETGTYKKGSYLSSFVGFNADGGSRVLVYVGFSGTPYLASSSAAPAFSTIMSAALNDMGIKPTS